MQHAVLTTKLSLKAYYREIRKLYISLALNPIRALKLKINAAAPVLSFRYLRTLIGAIKALFSLKNAHQHLNGLIKMQQNNKNVR